MAWRFKASKYKNAAPIVPKPEACIRDICVGSYQTYGNNICASAAFMAFNWEHVGSSLAVLPLDDCGRKSKTMPLLHAHSDTVTDMEFSPFHDGLLLTGSQDSLVKVWHIPAEGLQASLSTPECVLSQKQRRVENVGFHPVADGLIHVASGHELALWDLTQQKEAFVNREHGDVIQSTSWKRDGRLLASSCKDKKVRIVDPRAERAVADVAPGHHGIKDSRVVWLGDQDKILTTGFDAARLRQVALRDVRALATPVRTLELDCSTGVLMPLHDPDTGMLFLAGKGDTTILYMELSEREPYLVEGLRHSGEQTKGACLVPKRALRVMEAEVNRVLQLTGAAVVPITYQVPRKSYRDYHADLFPDTPGAESPLAAAAWLQHQDRPVPCVSLHPDAGSARQIHRGKLEDVVKAILAMPAPKRAEPQQAASPAAADEPKPAAAAEPRDEDRIDFVNVKDLIKGMERQRRDPRDTNGFHRKPDNGHDDSETEPEAERADERPERAERNEGSLEKRDSCESAEGALHNGALPPTPLPRSSISEPGAPGPGTPGPGALGPAAPGPGAPDDAPRPKPRTAPAPGYKPRLGPKPFSTAAGSDEFSFDKVFCVPAVPGRHNSESATSPSGARSPPTSPPRDADDKDKSLSPTSDVDAHNKEEYTNGKSDTSVEEDVNSSDSGYRPKTPSTAERRRMFETTDSAGSAPGERRRALERSLSSAADTAASVPAPPHAEPAPQRRRDSLKSRKSPDREDKRSSVPNITTKRTSTVFGKVSKFRHLKGTPGHKSTHIENIKNISRQVSGECNGFYANGVFAAVPLSGGGGRVGVLSLPCGATPAARAPRPPAGGVRPPALLHPAPLQDWAWDPFDDHRLMVACDDGQVREWIIPEGGLQESSNTPNRTWAAHPDKIYLLRFHPTARDVLATAAHDLSVKLWDLTADPPTAAIVLTGHTDQIFAMDWSSCGDYLATVCRDGKVRTYSPRASAAPTRAAPGPAGGRGARVAWALRDTHLVVTGFDKVSERQVLLYLVSDMSAPLCALGLDVSPAILQLHLDHDSSTLFLTGRGDSTIYCYEVSSEPPYLSPLCHHRAASLHQGLSFLHKRLLAVDKVEFARALRLTNGNIEPLSFTVPRIKSELFQDDLFPPTLVTWSAWQDAAAWLQGQRVQPRYHDLQPPGMLPLSQHQAPPKENKPAQKPKPDLIKSHVPFDNASVKDKQESIMKSMSARLSVDMKLEQDGMEGAADAEWEQH